MKGAAKIVTRKLVGEDDDQRERLDKAETGCLSPGIQQIRDRIHDNWTTYLQQISKPKDMQRNGNYQNVDTAWLGFSEYLVRFSLLNLCFA